MTFFSKKKYLLGFAFLLIGTILSLFSVDCLYAQQKNKTLSVQDTNYIKSYYKDVCITTEAYGHNSLFNVIALEKENTLVYHSNILLGSGISVDYKWFTIGYSGKLLYLNLYDSLYERGISEHNSLQLGFTGKKIVAKFNWQNSKGFYLVNADERLALTPDLYKKYFRRADIAVDMYAGTISYFFNNRKYSHLASIWQLEQQLKSAGSASVSLTFNRYKIKSDSSLVPSALIPDFDRATISREAFNLFVSGGYTYTFVFKKVLFFNLGGSFGVGFQKKITEEDMQNKHKEAVELAANLDFLTVLGYNGKRLYGGVSTNVYSFMDDFIGGVPFHYTFGRSRLFLGIRLKNKK